MVTYADPGDADQITNMVIEEYRRSLFLEGTGIWGVKLRHMDKMWFPRGVGQTWGVHSLVYDTGVRMVMPQNEYELNTNLTEADMGASCSANQSPV